MNNKNEKTVAKILFGDDAEYMYDKTFPGLCPICHNRLEDIPFMSYKVRKGKGDFFYTYDCFCIVTEKFKQFCVENKYPDLTFIPITASPGFYYFRPNGIFKMDEEHSNICFNNKRECCGSYDKITFSNCYKSPDTILHTDDFILQSNYIFGLLMIKSPLVIIGLETMKKMIEHGIKGVFFEDVYEYGGITEKGKSPEEVWDTKKTPEEVLDILKSNAIILGEGINSENHIIFNKADNIIKKCINFLVEENKLNLLLPFLEHENASVRYVVASVLLSSYTPKAETVLKQIKNEERNTLGYYAERTLDDWRKEKRKKFFKKLWPFN